MFINNIHVIQIHFCSCEQITTIVSLLCTLCRLLETSHTLMELFQLVCQYLNCRLFQNLVARQIKCINNELWQLFRSVTDLISITTQYSSCCWSCYWGRPSSKKAQDSIISNRIGMKLGRIVQLNMHRLTESDFWYNVTLSRWQPWRHLTQKSAATWWMLTQHMPGTCATVC